MGLLFSLLRLGLIIIISFFGLGIAIMIDIYVMDILSDYLVQRNVIYPDQVKYIDMITLISIWIMVIGFVLRVIWKTFKGLWDSIFK